jgi:hypothetical protein
MQDPELHTMDSEPVSTSSAPDDATARPSLSAQSSRRVVDGAAADSWEKRFGHPPFSGRMFGSGN